MVSAFYTDFYSESADLKEASSVFFDLTVHCTVQSVLQLSLNTTRILYHPHALEYGDWHQYYNISRDPYGGYSNKYLVCF